MNILLNWLDELKRLATTNKPRLALLSRIDRGLGFSASARAVRQARTPLADVRGYDPAAIYQVTRTFTCHADGLPFPVGALVNAELLGGVDTLQRLLVGRFIRPVGSTAAVSASPAPTPPPPAGRAPDAPVFDAPSVAVDVTL